MGALSSDVFPRTGRPAFSQSPNHALKKGVRTADVFSAPSLFAKRHYRTHAFCEAT